MEYFVYPLSGMRKEAAISVKSAQRVANLIEKARDRGVKTLWGTTLGGNLLGGVGGAVGTDKLIDEYEKRRQEADPEYKTSVWTRAGLNGLGGLAGAFGGGYIGQRAGLSLGKRFRLVMF